MLKRALKWIGGIYIASVLLVAAHFPQGSLKLVRDGHAGILLSPLAVPMILRGYGQFVVAGVWPYATNPTTVPIDQVLHAVGFSPVGEPNDARLTVQGSRSLDTRMRQYILYGEHYEAADQNALSTYGTMFKIGRYFCLSNRRHQIVGSPECARIVRQGHKWYWQELGNSLMRPVIMH